MNPSAPSSPPVMRRIFDGERGRENMALMLLWWILVRDRQGRFLGCSEGEESEEGPLLDSGTVVKSPVSDKRVDKGQKHIWPSVLAVQRWIELSNWR